MTLHSYRWLLCAIAKRAAMLLVSLQKRSKEAGSVEVKRSCYAIILYAWYFTASARFRCRFLRFHFIFFDCRFISFFHISIFFDFFFCIEIDYWHWFIFFFEWYALKEGQGHRGEARGFSDLEAAAESLRLMSFLFSARASRHRYEISQHFSSLSEEQLSSSCSLQLSLHCISRFSHISYYAIGYH